MKVDHKLFYRDYVRMMKAHKVLKHKVAMMNNNMANMRHYWKIQCDKRKAVSRTILKYQTRIRCLDSLEKSIAKYFGRKHISVVKRPGLHGINNKVYPVFLTHNDITRLKQFLRPRIGKRSALT